MLSKRARLVGAKVPGLDFPVPSMNPGQKLIADY